MVRLLSKHDYSLISSHNQPSMSRFCDEAYMRRKYMYGMGRIPLCILIHSRGGAGHFHEPVCSLCDAHVVVGAVEVPCHVSHSYRLKSTRPIELRDSFFDGKYVLGFIRSNWCHFLQKRSGCSKTKGAICTLAGVVSTNAQGVERG